MNKSFTHRLLGLQLACITALAACGTLSAATEVYRWTDENGVVHFVDTPPADAAAEKMTIEGASKPGSESAYPLQSDSEAADEGADPALSLADQRREKLAANRQKQQKQRAEQEQLCAQHRQRLQQVEPVRRVLYTDENGESVRLDDDERMKLVAESKNYIAKNCK